MVRYPIFKLLRVDYPLKAQCEIAAAKAQMSFCEWIREAMRDKLHAQAQRRKGKMA